MYNKRAMANTDDTDFLAQFLPVSMGGLIPDDAPVETVETEVTRPAPGFDSEGARAAELAALGRKGLNAYANNLGGGRHRHRFGISE